MQARLCSTALAALLTLTASVHAAERVPDAGEVLVFDIPAGDAEDTIAALSQQSKRLILAPGDAVAGVRMSALRGRYTFKDAIAFLLKGLPLVVAADDGRTVVLARRSSPSIKPRFLPGPVPDVVPPESVTVSAMGYRASLESSTMAKRSALGFTDAVFAEDIGKFPDTNIAEALNRVPGVTITREINGEGLNVQIRTLGTNFTKVLLNGNPIGVASTGATDSTNTNREVDLNWFPTELFTQLAISKSLSADQMEGGAAGTVSMRSIRPFDKPGFHINYNLDLTDQTTTNSAIGKRGAVIISDTEGSFGFLIGAAGVQNNVMVTGWEDGNSGWVTANLPAGACGAGNVCGQFGGGAWTIPASVPAGVRVPVPSGFALAAGFTPDVVNGTAYFPAGYPVNSAMLYALNPDLADSSCTPLDPSSTCLNQVMTRLSNTLLPRLGRPMFEKGSRDRYNGIFSFEYMPGERWHTYFDVIFSSINNSLNRSDIDWGVRGGNSATQMIPAGIKIAPDWLGADFTGGLGGAAERGTFYNAVFGLEARDYSENGDFLSFNPGASWHPSGDIQVNAEAYYTRSHFSRTNPTVMLTSCTAFAPPAGIDNCPNGPPPLGTVLNFDARGLYPAENINLDLNDPRNYEWYLGRLNLNGEKRYTKALGFHLDFTLGSEALAFKTGFAYDEFYRRITTFDNSALWQAEVCGDNPSTVLLGPNTAMPGCTGQVSATPAGWTRPSYPGFGTGYSAGAAPLSFNGSLIPTSVLPAFVIPGPVGFATVDYQKIYAATSYHDLQKKAEAATHCIPYCHPAGFPDNAVLSPAYGTAFDERNLGFYGKLTGEQEIAAHKLKYDVGLRWVETRQNVVSAYLKVDPRNIALEDGGYFPNYNVMVPSKRSYQAFLPSASFVYEASGDLLLRLSLSRSMNRPNPNAMSGGASFNDPSVTIVTLGNPNLKPYFSNNIDIGMEYYTSEESYIGIALFQKSVSGFTALLTSRRNFADLAQYGITWNSLSAQQQLNYQTSGGPSGVPCNSDATCADHPISVNQQLNLRGLEIIKGLEIDCVQTLDRLLAPWGLTGFGLAGNFTFIDQRSTGSVPTYAIGVAPYQYNVTGYYENEGVTLRLSYNWNDTSYGSSSNNQNVCFPANESGARPMGCPAGSYVFSTAYGQADFSSSLKLSQLFGAMPSDPAVTLEVQNLFDARQSSYGQLKSAVHSYYVKGQTIMLGLRGSF